MIFSDMKRCELLVRECFSCSVSTKDAPKRLMKFVRKVNGETFSIAWPPGWYFTFSDFLRAGPFGHLNIRDLEKKYLCCDKFLLPVGTVTDSKELAKVTQILVILISEGGRVFAHDSSHDSVHLISRVGFHSLLTDGLMKYPPLREAIGPIRYGCGDALALEFQFNYDLISLWRLCQKKEGQEFSWVCDDDLMCATVVGGVRAYESPGHQNWIKDTGSINVLQIFLVGMLWRGKWREIPILINDQLRVFGVNPESHRVEYLAINLPAFFKVGVLRLGNQQQYCRDSFNPKKGRVLAPAYRPTGCPRELFCRNLTKCKQEQREKKKATKFLCLGSKHVCDK
ncbi:tegument protein UL43 [Cercopithecine betaherpesvirus 5]|uniref:Tegument protein UL43 n=1 Tax=Simian cytomegalovirus (strain Colburn) TaxID=50292 RepID=G8XTB4_SCMVC|nr:tegument protein UL43 [Cercopithecine betaherpesvirus 5]AEV80407.1 tegument protein UL43 [Cercopithecine betaherpesvirus 5]